ncbi:TFIIH subunit Tfb4/p34 [Lipomyces arxii]|uniref:TFIIH subunit Tfb4/p34 n=1 Tax=Lipomyces arxii TaxID=56418 RepID=UPI0034CF3C46
MNAVDGSAHVEQEKFSGDLEDELPSLLVVVLDTNPLGWNGQISLREALSSLLIFLNSHLSLSHSNEVAVIASHTNRLKFLYPRPDSESTVVAKVSEDHSPTDSSNEDHTNGNGNGYGNGNGNGNGTHSMSDFSMYRQFRVVNESVLRELDQLLQETKAEDIERNGVPFDSTVMSGALSVALSYINRLAGGVDDGDMRMKARVLVVSVCADLASQYVPIMNSIFAAQKMKVPIDVCKLGNDTVFLQQAADTTGGVYLHLVNPTGLIQYLMTVFLPDRLLRKYLVLPTQSGIDFRAACFCHKRIVDIGYVCNICLSIFCQPPADGSCAVCDTIFDPKELVDLFKQPVVYVPGAKKKIKKKKKNDSDFTPTPGPS